MASVSPDNEHPQDDVSTHQPVAQEQPNHEAQPDKAESDEGLYCEFMELPKESLQANCPQCQQIIRDPYQVTCCGNSFCHSCIERIKADNKPCPNCNSKFSEFPDKRLQISVSLIQTRCSHQKDGCEWTGEVGQLDVHLNKDPPPEKQLDGCQFADIKCLYCEEKKQRQHVQVHQNEQCTKRPFSCEYCKEYKSHHDNIIYNHWPVCGSHPVRCPNECGLFLQRRKLDTHVANECPLTTISCDFQHIGCAVKQPRKDMPEHLRENLLTHTSLLAVSHAKQQAQIVQLTNENRALKNDIANLDQANRFHGANANRLQSNCNELAAENKAMRLEMKMLKEDNEKFKKEQTSLSQAIKSEVAEVVPCVHAPLIPSTVLTMNDFQQHKKDGDEWYSPSVYTHHHGYKIRLGVYANGHGPGEGTHLAVTLYFLKGNYDLRLKWPFRGVISFRLLDQVKGEDHKTDSLTYDVRVRDRVCSRVTEGERAKFGLGLNKFISHTKLESKYLQNDILQFQIHKVQLS